MQLIFVGTSKETHGLSDYGSMVVGSWGLSHTRAPAKSSEKSGAFGRACSGMQLPISKIFFLGCTHGTLCRLELQKIQNMKTISLVRRYIDKKGNRRVVRVL